jgi:hypothetical protein
MAALGSYFLTLADVAKSENKQIGKVAEVLLEKNAALNDIPYMEMNEGTRHVESIRSSLPAVYYRKANQAIPSGKSEIEERTFNGAHFEGKSEVDKIVAERGGAARLNFNRWNQAQGYLQAMALEHADLLFNGSPEDSSQKTPGLFDVYSTFDSSASPVAAQMIDGGGTGSDNTSIQLCSWGDQAMFGIFPSGTQGGLKRTDDSAGGKLIDIVSTDHLGNPGTFKGYRELFEIDHGLVVKDYRQGSRICNIDVTKLKSGVGAADLTDLMISAIYKLDSQENGTQVFYVNKTIMAFLHKQAIEKVSAGGGLTYDNYQGKKVLMFMGIPIRGCDAILNTQARIVPV